MELNEEKEHLLEEDDQPEMAQSPGADTDVEDSEDDEGDGDIHSGEDNEGDEGEDNEDDESDKGASSYIGSRLLGLMMYIADPMTAADDILGNYINELDEEG